jgi:ATP-dependent Lhr-like helicase
MTDQDTMSIFHPLVATWFKEKFGKPTDLQARAWPRIAAGEHVLITAPTGSGKTLAAFLWAVSQLVAGRRPLGQTSVLYVSPLKALNNDIQRNLLEPLDALRRTFEANAEPFPPIRVLTRSGDTPQSDRRRMQRHPPEILITTPESLNLLLSSRGGMAVLRGIATVILDEIHAVVNTKRGVHLITAVDRLVPLCGEFQRIALSATVQPPDKVAEFVGGYLDEGGSRLSPRPVALVASSEKKGYALQVRFPDGAAEERYKDSFWQPFVEEMKGLILRNRSTLIFANSRRLCERLTHLINLGETRPLAYAHHGSLSREIRQDVERRLKAGELRAIVATSSLELGIDIGALDEVVLVQSPHSVSSTIQRIGRAGHQVGEKSRGTLFPTHPQDLIEAAVLTSGVLGQKIEDARPVQAPLDVLAQVIISMVGVETWDIDTLYRLLKTSYPYQSLSRRHFDLVLNMLTGRYADSRVRELKPRISVDRLDNTVAARKGALQDLYLSGGTIPDRGYYHLRHRETGARIGDLDEEFVWEASVGQVFTLGTQNWKIEQITHNDVFVVPASPRAAAPPFWRAEEGLRDFHLSEQIGLFLEDLEDRLDDPGLQDLLCQAHCMDGRASHALSIFLKRQREATGSALPHRHHLLVEFISAGPDGYPGNQVVLHTLWGGQVNRPYAMALQAAWEARYGHELEVYVTDDAVALLLPHEVTAEELLSLVTRANVEDMIQKRLEGSGFFGARFRECAGRALLLTRRRMNERMPLWLSRLQSQRLMAAVFPYQDFPILLETWRSCLQDEFDMMALHQVLTEMETGVITWSETPTAHPSPMARGMTWRQINEYVYMDDQIRTGKTSMLSQDLLRQVTLSPELRPVLPLELIQDFELKRMRLNPGYSPDTDRDLLDWVKERLLLPNGEWQELLRAIQNDHGLDPRTLLESVADKLVRLHPSAASQPLIVAIEFVPRIFHGLYGSHDKVRIEPLAGKGGPIETGAYTIAGTEEAQAQAIASILGDWLQFYGPRTMAFIRETLGVDPRVLEGALQDLVDSERLVTGRLIYGTEEDSLCDRENLETLLRLKRAGARPAFEPMGIERLPQFLARFQGITNPAEDMDEFFSRLERLTCYPARAALWESEILPARARSYETAWLDAIVQEGDLRWLGLEGRRVCLAFEPDLELLTEGGDNSGNSRTPRQDDGDLSGLFPDPRARYDFSSLLEISGLRPAELAERLWRAVWRGQVTSDTFLSLRRGIQTGFKAPGIVPERPAGRRRPGLRASFSRWRSAMPYCGLWRRLVQPDAGDGPIEAEERNKDRVRLLLDRYGILFRELLQNELPPFQWSALFRSLRLMELSGEVLTGYFFRGLPGPQFISHKAFRMLQRKMKGDAVYWLSAVDPASLCGVQLEALKRTLPRRVPGAHLVYRGNRLVLVSQRHGKTLNFLTPPDDPQLPSYLGVLRHLLTRPFQPLRRIVIETINEEEAIHSPYVDPLHTAFDVLVDYKGVILYRRTL